MKLKTQNIMKTLDSNHRVIIKCDIPGEKIKQVTITEGKGCYTERNLVITKAGPTLEELLGQCTAENRHHEYFCDSQGKEML